MTAGRAPVLAHGMGKDLVQPDWPPLSAPEAGRVLSHYARGAAGLGGRVTQIAWWSPRPMSAAGLVRWPAAPAGTVFVKRHDLRVRTAGQLAAEHAFAAHLRGRGLTVPAVWRTTAGATAVTNGRYVYEVHDVAPGVDLYRDAVSWSPFASTGHARAAGAALAKLHLAAAGFGHPARPPGVLINSCEVITAVDPVQRVAGLAGRRPGLGGYLAARSWADDLAAGLLPAIRRAAPHLRLLPRQWGHGDWHPSNLTWTSAAPDAAVAAVFDLGLANRTFAVHDLAVAIERTAVAWLDLAEPGPASTGLAGLADRAGPADLAGLTDPAGPTDLAGLADLAGLDALLDGYRSVRPLAPAEAAALPEVLPVCHVEYALSEVEYFASVLGSPALADLAYHGYLLGHARWFTSPAGQALLAHLRRVLRDRRSR